MWVKGEEIPEIAAIIGVADAYDAMTSNRSYRKMLPQDVVRNEISKGLGTQFHPKWGKIMLQLSTRTHPIQCINSFTAALISGLPNGKTRTICSTGFFSFIIFEALFAPPPP